MNLEDLNLETQISELTRLQTRCIEAREKVQKIRAQIAALDVQAAESTAEIHTRLEQEARAEVEHVDQEIRNRLDQTEVDKATERETASEARERLLAELHAQLKEDVAECRQKLQNELWVLQSVCDESNEDTPVSNTERAQEVFQTQQTFLEQQHSDLDARVQATAKYLQSCHAPTDVSSPPVTVELKAREASRVTAVQQVDMALASAGKLDDLHLPQWIMGWRLYGLALLIFVVVAIGVTATRADLSKFLNPEFSKPDWEWFGVSCLIGLGAAVLIDTVLLMLAQSRLRNGFEEVLQATSNSKAASNHWKQKSRQELKNLNESASAWKADMLRRREQHAAKLQTATDERMNTLIQSYTEQVARQSRQSDEQILAGESACSHNQTALETWRSQELARIQAHYKSERERAENHFLQETAAKREQLSSEESAAVSRWRSNVLVASELARISKAKTDCIQGWSELRRGWKPPAALPSALPVGALKVSFPAPPENPSAALTEDVALELPGLLNFPRDTSILVEHDAAGRDAALDFVRAILLRLLTHIAPGRVQFTLIDPIGLGQSFSALMHLADFDELLISNRIWTESIQIRDRLQKVTEHMESVFQTYLRSEFETIEEYNAAAGEVAEPYHFVVVAGFPHSFTEEAARALTSILTSGPRCGVHAIVTWSPDQPAPRSFDVSNLRNGCTQFHVSCGKVQPGILPASRPAEKNAGVVAGEDFLSSRPTVAATAKSASSVEFQSLTAPDAADYVSLVRAVGEQSRNARRVEVSFSRIAPKADVVWSLSSADGIDFPIGRAGAARLQFMRLGRGTSQHVLVAGKTGSGKSTLLHILITNLSLYYSPDEIQFYLVDFKKGVEFRTYAANKLPHARVVAIESDREFGLSVLERLDEVLQERGELFRQRGVQDVPSFRRQFPDETMPRLLLLIDEFQEFFTSEDRVSSKAALLMDRLIRQGRAFGIHVLLGSQTLGGAYSLARSTMGQVAVRIALQCSESDAHLILSEENSAARLLTRPGEAIYNDANGMVEGNHPFQIAWLDEASRESMIHELTQRPDYHDRASERMIVFEGNVAPTVEECEPLNERIFSTATELNENKGSVSAWIGEPVSIAQPVCIEFNRSGGQNTLIVGQEGDLADSILASTILSLCAGGMTTETSSSARMTLLHDGRDPQSLANFKKTFNAEIAPRLTVRDAADADAVMAEFWTLLNQREAGDAGKTSPTLVLAVRNLGQFRSLRRDEDDFGMGGFGAPKATSPASQLGDLIRKGPLVGIHVIIWADTFGNAMRWLSNSLLREFDSRIAFRLNQTDSSSLIDNPAAASLTPGRAILYRDQTGAADRFRPFSWPSSQWLATVPPAVVIEDQQDQKPATLLTPVAELAQQIPAAAELTPSEILPSEAVTVLEFPVDELTVDEPTLDEPTLDEPTIDEPTIEIVALDDLRSSEITSSEAVPAIVDELPQVLVPEIADVVIADAVIEPAMDSVPEAREEIATAPQEPSAAEELYELPVVAEIEEPAAELPPAESVVAETLAFADRDSAQPVVESASAVFNVTSVEAGPVVSVTQSNPRMEAFDELPELESEPFPAAAHVQDAVVVPAVQPPVIPVPVAQPPVIPTPVAQAPVVSVNELPPTREAVDDEPDFVLEGSAAPAKPPASRAPVLPTVLPTVLPPGPVTKSPAKLAPSVPAPAAGKPADTKAGKPPADKVPSANAPTSGATQKPGAPKSPLPKPPAASPKDAQKPSAKTPAKSTLPAPAPVKPTPAPVAKTPVPPAPTARSAAPVPPTPVAQTPSAPAAPVAPPAPKVGKMSAMAMKMSNRNSNPRRLLDAPPEPRTQNEPRIVGGSADQPSPDIDFDEMDFNSLMIE